MLTATTFATPDSGLLDSVTSAVRYLHSKETGLCQRHEKWLECTSTRSVASLPFEDTTPFRLPIEDQLDRQIPDVHMGAHLNGHYTATVNFSLHDRP
jgi:hypothetical protein